MDDLYFSDFFPNTDQESSFVTRYNAIVPLREEDLSTLFSTPEQQPSSASANNTKNDKVKNEEFKKQRVIRKTPEDRVQHRRELNKKNAVRSRLRKKIRIENVIVRSAQLEQENALLKNALKQAGVAIPSMQYLDLNYLAPN